MNWQWLNVAYPFEQSSREKINVILSISIFASLIVMLLQPFGFTFIDQMLYFFGFLLIAVITLSINYFSFPYFFPKSFEERRWSILKAFLFLLYNFIIIGFWNHIFNALVIKKDLFFLHSGTDLLLLLFRTLAVGVVASFFLILIKYNFLARKHLQISQELNNKYNILPGVSTLADNNAYVTLILENDKQSFRREDLQYISANGNYVSLHFSKKIKAGPQLYRATMKEMEASLNDFPEFFRCHRSFIINLNAIESTIGNSQGLFIKMNQGEDQVPVARPKIKPLSAHLKKISSNKQFNTK